MGITGWLLWPELTSFKSATLAVLPQHIPFIHSNCVFKTKILWKVMPSSNKPTDYGCRKNHGQHALREFDPVWGIKVTSQSNLGLTCSYSEADKVVFFLWEVCFESQSTEGGREGEREWKWESSLCLFTLQRTMAARAGLIWSWSTFMSPFRIWSFWS